MSKDIATVKRTLEIIKKHDFRIKKSYGQNFLVDVNILKRIIDHASITRDTLVIEVGPGIGSLTEQLAKHAKKVVAYEIDSSLIPILDDTLGNYQNIRIINQDILKADVKAMLDEEIGDCQDVAVVANLPYYITTPILMNLLQQNLPINRYCVMMQKEVAERLCGGPSTKEYNSLTIAVQYYSIPKIVMHIPNTVFIPKPNVESAVLRLEVRDKPAVEVINEKFFFEVVRGSFIQRRKTIYNNLKQSLSLDKDLILKVLSEVGINPQIRGEALSIQQFSCLSDALYKEIGDSYVKRNDL